VTVVSKVSRGADGKTVTGSFEPEYKDKHSTVSATFSTEQNHTLNLTYNVDGATVGVTGESKGDSVDVIGSLDYVDERFALGLGISYPYAGHNPISLNSSLSLVYENLTVGGSYGTQYDVDKGFGDNEMAVALLFKGKDYSLAFSADKTLIKGDELALLKLGYSQVLNDKTTAGAGFYVDTDNDVKLTLASVTQLDSASSLRSRVTIKNTKQLNVGFVYQQKLNSLFDLSLGADLDTTSVLAGIAGKHQFQVKINLLD